VDRAAWFSLEEARDKLLPAQRPLLERLAAEVAARSPDAGS
jgi:predicted NUDIX family NTP pyrophosphohydrolase